MAFKLKILSTLTLSFLLCFSNTSYSKELLAIHQKERVALDKLFQDNNINYEIFDAKTLEIGDKTKDKPSLYQLFSKDKKGYLIVAAYFDENKKMQAKIVDSSHIYINKKDRKDIAIFDGLYLEKRADDEKYSSYMYFSKKSLSAYLFEKNITIKTKFISFNKKRNKATYIIPTLNEIATITFDIAKNDSPSINKGRFSKRASASDTIENILNQNDLSIMYLPNNLSKSKDDYTYSFAKGYDSIVYSVNDKYSTQCEFEIFRCYGDENNASCPLFHLASKNLGEIPIVNIKKEKSSYSLDFINLKENICPLHESLKGSYK